MKWPALLAFVFAVVWLPFCALAEGHDSEGGDTEPVTEPEPSTPPKPSKPAKPEEKPRPVRVRTDGGGADRRVNRPEFLILGSSQDVARAVSEIQDINGTLLRSDTLAGLGLGLSVVDLGPLMTPPILRARLARRGIDVALDRNATYLPAGQGRSYLRDLIGLPTESDCRLKRPVRVGMVDGPVDRSIADAAGVTVTAHSVLNPDRDPADNGHATALALLIAAEGVAGSPAGIAPGAHIFAAAALSQSGSRAELRLDDMVLALDWLVSERVELVNLSLSGPRNGVLARALQSAVEDGIVLVAAVGNNDRDDVAFPAAYPQVISVTAIDARKRRYRSANRGNEIDFAAPGVDVLVPGPGETAYRTGTSYATAIVSGLVAREIARGGADLQTIVESFAARAEDLGRPGHDSEFGWGLVHSGGC